MSHKFPPISAEEMAIFRSTALEKARLGRENLARRRQRAWEVARRGADLLKEEFGATKVILFGSLLSESSVHLRSDIDLAVWGLKGGDYYRAVSRLLSLDAEFEVDLVAFEDARPALQKVILEEGVSL